MQYGQFCPISKACEILSERWTILIVRELLCGSTRFNQFQRGLSQISPSLLTKRLNQLVDDEIIFKKSIPGQRRSEYFLTPAGKELAPIVMGMGDWGHKWAHSRMEEEELDIELLMLELFRRLDIEEIPGGTLVAHFVFPKLQTYPHWWIVIDGEDERELCVAHPGRDVDITIKSDAKTMCEIWNGRITFVQAKKEGRIELEGLPVMTRSVAKWLKGGPLVNGALVDQI
jgi:DNA-binding HxlR family transcriptional regulator